MLRIASLLRGAASRSERREKRDARAATVYIMEHWEPALRATFGLEAEDLPGLPYTVASGFMILGGYMLVSPVADNAAALAGNALLPVITVATLVVVAVASWLYQMLVKHVGMDLVMPIVYRILNACLLVFATALAASDSAPSWAFGLCIFTGAFSLYTQTTFWATMAHLHTRDQARRTFGLVAAGQQLGSIFAAGVAAALFARIHYWILLLGSLMVEATVHLVGCRRRLASVAARPPASQAVGTAVKVAAGKDEEARGGKGGDAAPTVDAVSRAEGRAECCGQSGGACADGLAETLDLMLGSAVLRMLTCHSFLTNFLTGAIYYERAHAAVVAFATSALRVQFFSVQNGVVSACTLVLQAFVSGRLTRAIGLPAVLVLEPLSALAGLVAYAVYPGLASIILLDGVRKVVHYSVMKPARESIFSQLDGDVKFRAKAFIDAFVFRSGSAAAAGYFAVSHAFGADMRVRAAICLAVSLVWLAVSYKLGCAADALGERQAASGGSATVERGGGAELATAERGSGAEELAPTSPSSSTEETPMLPTAAAAQRERAKQARWMHRAIFAGGAVLVVTLATLAVTVCFTSPDKRAYCERSS